MVLLMDNRHKKLLGQQIRKARRRQRLTQEELSDLVEVTPKYISRIEAGWRVPSIFLLFRISRELRVKIRDLFTF